MAEIAGPDTLIPHKVNANVEEALSFESVLVANAVQSSWDAAGLGILPSCCKCRVPVVWHSPPETDGTLFHCPECGKRWLKDGKWAEDSGKYRAKCRESREG